MSGLEQTILIAQLASTLPLVGLIWTIQLVHYPLFARVPEPGFSTYQHEHMRRITWIVFPLMMVELASSIGLVALRPDSVLAILGMALVVGIWCSTAFIQVPCHRDLAERFDREVHDRLVGSNWLRTIAWTARGVVVLVMVAAVLGTG